MRHENWFLARGDLFAPTWCCVGRRALHGTFPGRACHIRISIHIVRTGNCSHPKWIRVVWQANRIGRRPTRILAATFGKGGASSRELEVNGCGCELRADVCAPRPSVGRPAGIRSVLPRVARHSVVRPWNAIDKLRNIARVHPGERRSSEVDGFRQWSGRRPVAREWPMPAEAPS